MPIPSVPPPPPQRSRWTNQDGTLTTEARRWLDALYAKIGSAGLIPSESLSSKSTVNSSNNVIAEWDDVDASSGRIIVHGPNSLIDQWERYEGTREGYRTVGPFPAAEFTGLAYGRTYYIAYDPATQTYMVETDYRKTLKDGIYAVGVAKANATFGGSGAIQGGGGSANPPPGEPAGVGGLGEVAPGVEIGGYGLVL